MRLILIITTLFFITFISQALVPFSLSPIGLSLSQEKSENIDSEFEFPPLNLPVMDESIIQNFKFSTILISGTGTATGICCIILGLNDFFTMVDEVDFTSSCRKGLFLVSTGIVISGISISALRPALDTYFK